MSFAGFNTPQQYRKREQTNQLFRVMYTSLVTSHAPMVVSQSTLQFMLEIRVGAAGPWDR